MPAIARAASRRGGAGRRGRRHRSRSRSGSRRHGRSGRRPRPATARGRGRSRRPGPRRASRRRYRPARSARRVPAWTAPRRLPRTVAPRHVQLEQPSAANHHSMDRQGIEELVGKENAGDGHVPIRGRRPGTGAGGCRGNQQPGNASRQRIAVANPPAGAGSTPQARTGSPPSRSVAPWRRMPSRMESPSVPDPAPYSTSANGSRPAEFVPQRLDPPGDRPAEDRVRLGRGEEVAGVGRAVGGAAVVAQARARTARSSMKRANVIRPSGDDSISARIRSGNRPGAAGAGRDPETTGRPETTRRPQVKARAQPGRRTGAGPAGWRTVGGRHRALARARCASSRKSAVHKRVAAEKDRGRGCRGGSRDGVQPRIDDAIGQQQIGGEAILGRRPRRFIRAEAMGQEHPRVDDGGVRQARHGEGERLRAVTVQQLAEHGSRRTSVAAVGRAEWPDPRRHRRGPGGSRRGARAPRRVP